MWRNIMKTLIYTTLFFLTLNTLYAQEVQHYQLSLTSLDFAKTDKIIPGVTLDLTPKEAKDRKFQVTLAHNLFKSVGSLVKRVNPMKTALYAQMHFRF